MGGGRKLKDSARPQSAILSGEQGGGGDGAGSFDESELPVLEEETHLAVNLVMLNPQVHALTKVDDPVSVDKDGVVITKHGRLGDIPPGFRQTVRERNLTTGIVAKLSIVPLGATVLLSTGQ